MSDDDRVVDGRPGDADRVVDGRLAGTCLALAGAAGLFGLATTGHDRVVAVVAFGTLLLGVLYATATALAVD